MSTSSKRSIKTKSQQMIKLDKAKDTQKLIRTVCDDSSSAEETQPSVRPSSVNLCMVDLKDLQKRKRENRKHSETKLKNSSESGNSSAEQNSKLISDDNTKSKKRKTSKLANEKIIKEVQNKTVTECNSKSKEGNKSKLTDDDTIKKLQNRTNVSLSEDCNDSDSEKQEISRKEQLKLSKHRKNTKSMKVKNDGKKQKSRNEESESSDSEVETYEKQTRKTRKEHINFSKEDVISSSGEEFQKSKFSHISSSYKRKLFQGKGDHMSSTKSSLTFEKQAEGRTEISKEQSLLFKSRVIKILNRFKEACSEYELSMERIQWKYLKKDLGNQASANNVILKSRNVITKFKSDLDTQEKDLVNFYDEWSKRCKLRNVDYESNFSNENEVSRTTDSKKKSSLPKKKSFLEEECLVSECDSEEIFSGDEKKCTKITGDKNKEAEVSMPDQTSERSASDSNENVSSSEDNRVVSPILVDKKRKATSDKSDVKDKSKIVEARMETSEDNQEDSSNLDVNNSLQDIFEESTEKVDGVNVANEKKSESEKESDPEKGIDEMVTTKTSVNEDKTLPETKELSVKSDDKHLDVDNVKANTPDSFFSQETLTSKVDDNESIATVGIEREENNSLDNLNDEEAAKKAMLESDSDIFPNEKSIQISTEGNLNDKSKVQFEKIKSTRKEEANERIANSSDKDNSSSKQEDVDIDAELYAKHALLESNSDDSMSPSSSKEMSDKTHNSDTSSKDKYAKAALLASSDSESLSSDSNCSLQNTNVDSSLKKQKEERKKNSLQVEDISTFDTSVSERVKKRRTRLSLKCGLENDEKLKMRCHVVIEKLPKHILKKHASALEKSRQDLDNKEIKSLTNLESLKRDIKKKNSSRHSSFVKKTKGKETEETLLDHLKRVENGEFVDNSKEDSDLESMNLSTKAKTTIQTNEDLMKEADMATKKMLLDSTDSDNEQKKTSESNNSEQEGNDGKTNDEKKESSKKTKQNSSTNNEDDEEEREKGKWRRNKILTMKFSDSDSDVAKEKLEKKKQKLREKEEENHTDSSDENAVIKRKRRNRKIVDSDSDLQLVTSDSDSSSLIIVKDNKSSDSDFSVGRKQNKISKRKTHKSSDSDSSPVEKRPKKKRKRIRNMDSDSEDNSDDLMSSQGTPGKKGRKNIRKVLKDKHIADDTKQAAKEEEERLKRIAERQKVYNEMYEARLAGEEKVDKLVLDFDPETKEELLSVHKDLVKRLKPHQAKGIKFMWDACFESLERMKTSSGSGCIIAHCMGLGKTLQVIALIHTLLTHEKTGINTIMVVCPLSTVLNWYNEFNLWLKDVDNGDIDIFELTKYKQNVERATLLKSWQRSGGVLIIGYEMFRNLSGANNRMRKAMKEEILQCLIDPGPDLIVCDEGHLLKNEDSALSKSIKRIKTLRRIVLTGTPLQNNLIEYHCMVQFIKPNLLGTRKEFLNRFANPITNGQFDDSTESDVKLMKKRAYVLHKMLKGSVQRFDYSVLMPFLPPKHEYVIFVSLTDVQIKMYQHYLDNFARQQRAAGGSLFADFQVLQRIWTHPMVLRLNSEKNEKAREKKYSSTDTEGSLRNFIDDGSNSESDSSSSSNTTDDDVKSINSNYSTKNRRSTRNNNIDVEEDLKLEEPEKKEEEWWLQFTQPEDFDDMRISAKLMLLFGILKECGQIGDKVLIFSQSLYSLTLIEQFLEKIDDATQNDTSSEYLVGHRDSWTVGLDYFRLDGQTSADNRNRWCKIFNKPSNTRARLFLISTRAGGLGINLTAANRVIIFDASWNPSHDVQSIFRVYRFGQKKPCYIYRFLAAGTMEEKIYNRQVTKLSLSCRVVDEQQIERHYSNNDLSELYKFEPNTSGEKPTLNLPKDRVLAEIFLKYKNFVENYHEHDSLLENKTEEELDEEERKQAWLEYEEEKKGKPMQMYPTVAPISNSAFLNHYGLPASGHLGTDYEKFRELIRKDYPNATPEFQQMMTAKALTDMYNYWERQTFQNTSSNQMTYQNAGVMPTQLRTQVPNLSRMPLLQNLNTININGQTRDELPITNQSNGPKSRNGDDDVVEITSTAVSKTNKTQEE
ncbi:transcriptional regulator ATRX homolog isoform X1 [Hylaeus volcanicus]|uniref:transcriptional regulator ATRX homolog isoform X1 n=1 Tax=Hylaeus volcanicus TaxID=313075 RepID=UPI0023B7B149|nr:transcriptional regulator ATRX homolog isoform X1 [Hylaeus volcanicus]XP_053988591.1 transcriptional regulator ATRX homolog isoform X1 [Hylaeus volcanicus]